MAVNGFFHDTNNITRLHMDIQLSVSTSCLSTARTLPEEKLYKLLKTFPTYDLLRKVLPLVSRCHLQQLPFSKSHTITMLFTDDSRTPSSNKDLLLKFACTDFYLQQQSKSSGVRV
jgi:hypothetical protein